MALPFGRNALLITIDSLSYGRLVRSTTPTLDRLSNSGLSCTRAYANSWYTQFSYPSLFSSTLPLDCGGYDEGIATRPASLPEVMQQHGYQTAGFSSDPYLEAFYGYDRGFDAFFELFDLQRLFAHVNRDYLRAYKTLLVDEVLAKQEVHRRTGSLMRRLLEYADGYLRRFRDPAELHLCRSRSPLYERDFGTTRADVSAASRALDEDETNYIDSLLAGGTKPCDGEQTLRDRITGLERRDPVVDAFDIVNFTLTYLRRLGGLPFFVWLSLSDYHDLSPEPLELRVETAERVQTERLRQASVRFLDRAIERLLSGLDASGLLDSTTIVICADHGLPSFGPKEISTSSGTFSDEIIRVPLIFWHGRATPMVHRQPVSLLDVAPTLLDLLDLPPEPRFRGTSIRQQERPHVVIEQLGGGPCDLALRQPYLCLVGKNYKYACSPTGQDWLHDLRRRPRVGFVAADDPAVDAPVDRLRAEAKKRYETIQEQRRRSGRTARQSHRQTRLSPVDSSDVGL